MSKSLVIFDYDWSLINENSDTYIFKKLHPPLHEELHHLLREHQGQWTKTMDYALGQLHQREPNLSLTDIRKCLEEIPIQDNMIQALLYAKQKQCDIYILSDANTLYIQWLLERYEIHHIISHVFTNRAYVDDSGRIRVFPFHEGEAHNCELCPVNMCKGL